jgi:hypothetical protein
MVAAVGLYESLGFTDIPPYNDFDPPSIRFMELVLVKETS